MREKLKTYIDFLFAGAPQTAATAETKAEILQNTLDKYDDLIAQGKSPEAAYSLAVSGIGDLRELLGGAHTASEPVRSQTSGKPQYPSWISSLMLALAVMMYITCVVPVILSGNVVLMFGMIAIATGLLIIRSNFVNSNVEKREKREDNEDEIYSTDSPRVKLRKSINGLISAITLVVYLFLSFTTMAWHITWVIFPLSAAVQNIVKACFELAE